MSVSSPTPPGEGLTVSMINALSEMRCAEWVLPCFSGVGPRVGEALVRRGLAERGELFYVLTAAGRAKTADLGVTLCEGSTMSATDVMDPAYGHRPLGLTVGIEPPPSRLMFDRGTFRSVDDIHPPTVTCAVCDREVTDHVEHWRGHADLYDTVHDLFGGKT